MTALLADAGVPVVVVARRRDRLIELLGSRDLDVKTEAALALAAIEYFDGDVLDILRSLRPGTTP